MVTVVVTLVIGGLFFKKYLSPGITAALEQSVKTSSNLAKLANVKSIDTQQLNNIEGEIASDIVNNAIPEIQGLQFILKPETWERVEEMIENNPAQVIALYEKYKHLIPGLDQKQEDPADVPQFG